ncbi:MAG: hypothetical protein P4M00_18850 [Azospirillaceae bacterium]|nr:hypothetical protein [Azospirillaceae bacterium]
MDDEAFDTWLANVSHLTAAQRSQGFRALVLAEACLNEPALLGIAAVPIKAKPQAPARTTGSFLCLQDQRSSFGAISYLVSLNTDLGSRRRGTGRPGPPMATARKPRAAHESQTPGRRPGVAL